MVDVIVPVDVRSVSLSQISSTHTLIVETDQKGNVVNRKTVYSHYVCYGSDGICWVCGKEMQ